MASRCRRAYAQRSRGEGESVKRGEVRLARCETHIVATPQMVLEGAARGCGRHGFNADQRTRLRAVLAQEQASFT
jgi:glycerate-2-kinase